MTQIEWAGINGPLSAKIKEQTARCLDTYRTDTTRVEQDAAIESGTAQGGYGRKQLFELIQNGADALLGGAGRIHVVLTKECLYVANEGRPLASEGIGSLMASHLSRKRGDEIGRFGLGFKSVVAISDRPQIISRTGSFGFDRAKAKSTIETVVTSSPAYPMLRTAEPIDATCEAQSDAILAELMEWASTIVRVPLARGHDHLARDVLEFPAQFLLFSPHASELILENRDDDVLRRITVTEDEHGVFLLADSMTGIAARHRVVSCEHRPSKAALADAGDRAHRDVIRVSWAVPLDSRVALGRLWAFFPTEDRTTLAGIINAPWKTTDDRRHLLEGKFNHEILTEVLPTLIALNWHLLMDPAEPASILDVLPARGKEGRSWADKILNEPVFAALRQAASLPDVGGALNLPSSLRVHPDRLGSEILASWASVTPRQPGWISHGIDATSERRLKVERLGGHHPKTRADIVEWVQALTHEKTPASSAAAVLLVNQITQERPELKNEVRRARVVLLEDGSLAPAMPGQIFVRSSSQDSGFNFIHADLAALPAVRAALDAMGVKVLDRAGELRHLISGKNPGNIDWNRAWSLIRQCTPAVAREVLFDELPEPLENSVRVRTRSGAFVTLGGGYLPGVVVSETDPRDAALCFDTKFHRAELQLLSEIGCVSQPTLRHDPPVEPWLVQYKNDLKKRYIEVAKGAKPSMEKLTVVGAVPPWPLEPLKALSNRGRLVAGKLALGLTSGEPYSVKHVSNAAYEPKSYMNPVHWAVLNEGRLETAFGPLPVAYCLAPNTDHPADVLPVVDLPEQLLRTWQIKQEPSELEPEAWDYMLRVAAAWDDVHRTSRVYAWACWFTTAPRVIKARVGRRTAEVAATEVAVVSDESVFQALVEQSIPVILVEEESDAVQMQQKWALENGKRLLEQQLVHQPQGEPEVLVDRFPMLRLHLDPAQFDLKLQPCSSVDLVTATRDGMRSKPVPQALDGGAVLVTATEPENVLRQVSEALQLELTAGDIRSVIDQIREQEVDQLVARIRGAESDHARFAILVGRDRLRRSVPKAAIDNLEDELERPLDDVELATLVLSVHGVAALQHFRQHMEDEGLNPPLQWAGLSAARRFVADLGFAPEYAGFASDSRPAVFTVEGPADLLPLHDYQVMVTTEIKKLLRGNGSPRGMVSLPTGAGKTRVAVQALVEEVRDGSLTGPVVWIAQSDELCEQAVETWSYIWRALGPAQRMTVGRLWGSNEVEETTEGFHLVVATPDKLSARVESPTYEWLTETSVVVVDEAHSSIAASYTKVLDWLGRGRSRKERRPLLGLTATPFRGTSATETKRLAGRYDHNRLDDHAFVGDPYGELQKRGVLARVNHQLLKGAELTFSAKETAEIESMHKVPRSIEAQLGEDVERNRRIVESIVDLPDDWTVLLFATSVENARVLAAMLSFKGVSAVAVSGDTDGRARKHYVDEFKAGRIRVITNYAVLTQGFDAPRVQAVYVTRPTFSPNVYQQMIGRGLRGPLNGGSEEVLIVNVEDNFQQFGDQLAFQEFEHLWNPEVHE